MLLGNLLLLLIAIFTGRSNRSDRRACLFGFFIRLVFCGRLVLSLLLVVGLATTAASATGVSTAATLRCGLIWFATLNRFIMDDDASALTVLTRVLEHFD